MIFVIDYLNFWTFCKLVVSRPKKIYYVFKNKNAFVEKIYIRLLRISGISIENFDQPVGALWRDASSSLDRFVLDSFEKLYPSQQKIGIQQYSFLFYNNYAAIFFLIFTCRRVLKRKKYKILVRSNKISYSVGEKFNEIESYLYPNPFSSTKTKIALKFQYWACNNLYLNLYKTLKLLIKIFSHYYNSFFSVQNSGSHFFHLNPIFSTHNAALTKNFLSKGFVLYGNTKKVFSNNLLVPYFFYLSGRSVIDLLKFIWASLIASNNFNFGVRLLLLEVLVESEIVSKTLISRDFKFFYTDFESPVNYFIRRSLDNSGILTLARTRSWGFIDFPTRFGHLWKAADINFVLSKDHADIFLKSGDLSKRHMAIGFPVVPKRNLESSSISPAVCLVDNICRNDIYHSENELGVFIEAVIRCCDENDLSLRIKAKKNWSVGCKLALSKSISLDFQQGVFPDVNIKTIFIGFGLTTVLQIASRLGYRVLVFDPCNLTPSDLKGKFLRVEFFDKIELLHKVLNRGVYENFDNWGGFKARESDDDCIVRVLRSVSELYVSQDKSLVLENFSRKFAGSLISHGVNKNGPC